MKTKPVPVFDNSYSRLPEHFYSRQSPVSVSAPLAIRTNRPLARQLGFDPDWLESQQGIDFVAGNFIPDGAEPIATVYAGHQFGGWNPQLGDGRAVLMGEVIDEQGQRFDIQLKGSGRTPYSRGGDGRAPLGPVLREYLVSEAMAVLGVPTSRTLAAVTTGERVNRDRGLPGAVLARVASSHIRIGTVQYFAALEDHEAVRVLIEHVQQRHYPETASSDNGIRLTLDGIIERQARLIALWQSIGFIHGVMNTDNMLLSGETIDYGPCAFMDTFNANTVYSSIDHSGRYAYRNQPQIAHWNLGMLTQSLLPNLDEDTDKALASGQAALDAFPALYQACFQQRMLKKIGLSETNTESDTLIQDLLALMQEHRTDFTLTFRRLSDLVDPENASGGGIAAIFEIPESFEGWATRWKQAMLKEPMSPGDRQTSMYLVNPVYIPRNHLVEEAINAAERHEDFEPFNFLLDLLANPFGFDAANSRYALPPEPEQVVTQTFCGT